MHTTETNLAYLARQALNCRTTETHSLRIVAFGTALPLSAHLPFFDETSGVLTIAVDLPQTGTVEADLRQQLEDEAGKVTVLMTTRSALGRKVRELEAELVEARAELAEIKQDEPQAPYTPEVRGGGVQLSPTDLTLDAVANFCRAAAKPDSRLTRGTDDNGELLCNP